MVSLHQRDEIDQYTLVNSVDVKLQQAVAWTHLSTFYTFGKDSVFHLVYYSRMPVQDFVAILPDPIIQLKRLGAQEGKDFFIQEGFIARIEDKEFFILLQVREQQEEVSTYR